MLLRLSRIRKHDPMGDADLRKERVHSVLRAAHADSDSPALFLLSDAAEHLGITESSSINVRTDSQVSIDFMRGAANNNLGQGYANEQRVRL